MDEPALNSLIKQRVEEAVTNVQTDMLKHMDRIITNRFDTFQKSVKENQRELSETDLAKIEEMNSDNYVFKRKGNEEQFKINSKIANKMKEARGFLRDWIQTNRSRKQ
jgi:molecular chaperone DnaK (HSP70)